MDLKTVLAEVDRWPVEDRLKLVREVWNQLEALGLEPDLPEGIRDEIDRRLEAHEANPSAAVPWEQVEAEALARLRQ